ncbi:MAG: rhamnulokinase family protein, partial [Candidatus Fimimonas sp.]
MNKYYLAVDIGASSGRHIVGFLQNNEIMCQEVYRFPNGVTNQNGSLTWDVHSLFHHVKQGVKNALLRFGKIESMSVDTWGVDYVLMNGNKEILPCYAYRDDRTTQAIEQTHKIVPFAELYAATGIQFQPFNTVYQLQDDLSKGRLKDATDFLMIPEYLIFKLTGKKVKEYTNATTTGLVNAETKQFDEKIIGKLGLPKRLFGSLCQPKTVVGQFCDDVATEVGGQIPVVLCATHDTASAVEGVSLAFGDAYLSSGTWSLLGAKCSVAHTDEFSRKNNWSNEGGVGYVRYQKNIMGMWVINRLKEELCPNTPFEQINEMTQNSCFEECVDVNHSDFLAPQSMKQAFDKHLQKRVNAPLSVADYFKCAVNSLAKCYATAVCELEKGSKTKINRLV